MNTHIDAKRLSLFHGAGRSLWKVDDGFTIEEKKKRAPALAAVVEACRDDARFHISHT